MNSLSQLHWQCRRGTQELDRLLSSYLHTTYTKASKSEQQLFEYLLTHEDSELLAFLLDGQSPKEPQFAKLITKICSPTIIYD